MRRFNMVRTRDPLWHIETPLGIVNITVGLHDADGNPVDSIEVIADQGVERDGYANTRLIRRMSRQRFGDPNRDKSTDDAADTCECGHNVLDHIRETEDPRGGLCLASCPCRGYSQDVER